jgi:hypothetical protein
MKPPTAQGEANRNAVVVVVVVVVAIPIKPFRSTAHTSASLPQLA